MSRVKNGGGGGGGGAGVNRHESTRNLLTSIHPFLRATILECKKLNNRKCFLFFSLFCYFMFGKN